MGKGGCPKLGKRLFLKWGGFNPSTSYDWIRISSLLNTVKNWTPFCDILELLNLVKNLVLNLVKFRGWQLKKWSKYFAQKCKFKFMQKWCLQGTDCEFKIDLIEWSFVAGNCMWITTAFNFEIILWHTM